MKKVHLMPLWCSLSIIVLIVAMVVDNDRIYDMVSGWLIISAPMWFILYTFGGNEFRG